ncbi:hypothetical protein [Bordetella parapertussis]|uniref:hypothetical protein n=1 Tax=Bordetella parapertussis TaxID=519 RepID=UPI000310837C|nr:hypothetical protein [Bordetella parapertussis]
MSLIYDALRNGPSATGPGAPVGRGFAGAPARPARGPASDAQQLNALLRQMMANQERLERMQAELAAMAPPAAPAVGFPLPAAGMPGAALAAAWARRGASSTACAPPCPAKA